MSENIANFWHLHTSSSMHCSSWHSPEFCLSIASSSKSFSLSSAASSGIVGSVTNENNSFTYNTGIPFFRKYSKIYHILFINYKHNIIQMFRKTCKSIRPVFWRGCNIKKLISFLGRFRTKIIFLIKNVMFSII